MIKDIISNPNVIATVVFCIAAAIGQFIHAVKKWADGEVGTPLDWITKDARHTFSAILGNLGGMLVFIQTGVLGPIAAQPDGWWAVVMFGFMNGFTADSALNKSTRQEWTAEERAAKASGT